MLRFAQHDSLKPVGLSYLKNFHLSVNYFLDVVAQIRYFYAQASTTNIRSFEELL